MTFNNNKPHTKQMKTEIELYKIKTQSYRAKHNFHMQLLS